MMTQSSCRRQWYPHSCVGASCGIRRSRKGIGICLLTHSCYTHVTLEEKGILSEDIEGNRRDLRFQKEDEE